MQWSTVDLTRVVECSPPPEALWPILADTDRFNSERYAATLKGVERPVRVVRVRLRSSGGSESTAVG